MSRYRSSDEVRAENVAKMGARLGTVYHALTNECTWLHLKWREYTQLFGTSRERVDLLNTAAGSFFRIVQDVMWEDLLLHIARLADPPKSAGKENLTIRALPGLIDNAALRSEVERALDLAVERSAFARDWRKRHIAHRDLALAVDDGASPLQAASQAQVTSALESIGDVLNRVELHFSGGTVAYEFADTLQGAEALLYVLRDGVGVDRSRRERLRSGRPTEEDIGPQPPL